MSSKQLRYYYRNKEKILEKRSSYYQENKEKISEYQKEYHQTEAYNKTQRISSWKRSGLIETEQYTYDELYEAYLAQGYCEECGVELTTGGYTTATTKCMDHDHTTGIFRDVLCHSCNIKRR